MAVEEHSAGLTGTIYLIVTQVVSRGLTFIGNQALLRYVSPGHLGLAVQLEALSVSILYTARDSLRVALQRRPQDISSQTKNSSGPHSCQPAINSGWLVVVLGLLLGSIFGSLYIYSAGQDILTASDLQPALLLYAFATVFELFSEPCFVVLQHYALFKDRARAETTAAITRCVAACTAAVIMYRIQTPMSVLPFAVGQASYGFFLALVYLYSAVNVTSANQDSLLPTKLPDGSDAMLSRFPRPLLSLAGAFYGQSIFKWLLTQGDTLVLSFFADLRSQGIFALASNYGGLASRLLFQPIEESSRNTFGRLLANNNTPKTKQPRSPGTSPELVQRRSQALQYLSSILHVYMLAVAIPCTILLPKIFPIAIQALLGSKSQWNTTQTAALLSAYSYYIPCLAINGILDAFVSTVATEAELGAQSLMMVGVTMIYLSAAYLGMTVLQLGAVGLVYANILNMVLRITFSIWFIRVWTEANVPEPTSKSTPNAFRGFLNRCLPSGACLATSLLVGLGMQMQDQSKILLKDNPMVSGLSQSGMPYLNLDLYDLTYLTTAATVLISSMFYAEREFLHEMLEPILPVKIRQMIAKTPKTAKETR